MLSFLLLSFLLLPQFACDTTEPISNTTLNLKLEDVSCTEAWIQFSSTNIQIPNNVTLYINNQPKKTINLTTADTLLYIDSLLPSQTYKLKVSNTQYSLASNELSITTMETTSHNFTWQTWTFGDKSSSTLYDVAIINENNIWAVGQIYTADSYTYDSLGNWIDPYNAVHWDGSKWELMRIYYNYYGTKLWNPIKSILAFNSDDIWFGAGIHWNGIDFTTEPMNIDFPYQINKMWGTSSNDFYVVGTSGSMAHYNGISWIKIESGTNLDIQDICGINNPDDSQQEILCIAADKYQLVDKKIFNISIGKVSEVSNEGLPWSLSSIWFCSKYKCYIVGDGLFIKNLPNAYQWLDITDNITSFYTNSIRGNRFNDIVVSGANGELLHYNGLTWQSYRGNGLPVFAGNYFSVSIRGNITCTVGEASISPNKAIIALGIR